MYTVISPAVLGYFRARGVDDAEALTQDVFVDVLPKLAERHAAATAGLRTFIFSVAHARLVDYQAAGRTHAAPGRIRSPERRPLLAASAEDEALGSLGGISDTLARLNDEQREVLVLRIVADLSIEQVAGIMDKTPGAIKQLQRRGLSALRELVTEKDHAAS